MTDEEYLIAECRRFINGDEIKLESAAVRTMLVSAFHAGARVQARIDSDFIAELSESILGYREGTKTEIKDKICWLVDLEKVSDISDSKNEILTAVENLKSALDGI